MSAGNLREILNGAAEQLRGLPTGRRDAELLLMRAVGRDRAWLLTHADAELTREEIAQFESCVVRRARQEPVQYILGETEFFGLTLRVTPDVLIPRPETEHLVEAAIELMGREEIFQNRTVRICDVGTGSGAIAVALAHALPRAEVTAVDASAAALAIARENAERHGVAGRVRLLESDLLSAVGGEKFDLVVSNPPYVRDDEVLEAQVREYEPRGALFAGATGLEVYERLIPQAWDVLVPEPLRYEKNSPQGLKPGTSSAGYGTAEAVPLHGDKTASLRGTVPLKSEKTDSVRGVAPLHSEKPDSARGVVPLHSEKSPAARGTVPLQEKQVLGNSTGGWLLMEIGHGQRAAVEALLGDWDGVSFQEDLQGIPRVAIAQARDGE